MVLKNLPNGRKKRKGTVNSNQRTRSRMKFHRRDLPCERPFERAG